MEIKLAIQSDLDSVKRIADTNKESLGFLPRPIFEKGILSQEIVVAKNEDMLCGFVHYHLRKDGILKIYQICVETNVRRQAVGSTLVRYIVNRSKLLEATSIVLLCPEELDANRFYANIGFCKGELVKGKKRQLQSWRLKIYDPQYVQK